MLANSLMSSFSVVSDPRGNRTKKHELTDIIVIAVCGAISGCDSWTEIEEFGEVRKEWPSKYLNLENGIPSHYTFGRVFSLIVPIEFQKAFMNWGEQTFKLEPDKHVAIDGKYFRATGGALADQERRRKVLGTVNAWATGSGVAIGQVKTYFHKNCENVVVKELIDLLELNG